MPAGELLRPDAVFLPESMPDIDISGLSLKAGTGKAIVLMAEEREQSRGILLSDTLKGAYRPDVGRLVSLDAGYDKYGARVTQSELSPGDYVVVRGYAGFWEDRYHNGHQIRFLGRQLSEDQEWEGVPWDDSIVLKWDAGWKPVGRNMLVRRAKHDNPLLPKELAKYENWGVVEAVGGSCDPDFVGMRVWWKDAGPEECPHVEFSDEKDLFVVPGWYVEMVA